MLLSIVSKIKKALFHFIIFYLLFSLQVGYAQLRNEYEISFENAVHHEATIHAVFRDIKTDTISFHMSRTSPGKYGLYEFAKNVSNVTITDGNGEPLSYTKPTPHQWEVTGHNGTIFLTYSLFGDRGDGTHVQINQNHALLNTPATFMYAPLLKDRPVQLNIVTKNDPNWNISTQLLSKGGNSFLAPNLEYFMDSPILLGKHTKRSYTIQTGGITQTIQLAITHKGSEEDIDILMDGLKKAIEETQTIFGTAPTFDYGSYTFLICTHPSVTKDGMAHRNSSVITNPKSIQKNDIASYTPFLKALTREFIHTWNLERLQPLSLSNFRYDTLQTSNALWFVDGFTEYYTYLTLKRAGILSTNDYLTVLTDTYNDVWNAPAIENNTCIDMSLQAPLIDATSFTDPLGTHNSFVSYRAYGHMIALALDLSLRSQKKDTLSLDGFMTTLWNTYGISETPYTITNLQETLTIYAGKEFSDSFFNSYIFDHQQPNYVKLFSMMSVIIKDKLQESYLGAHIKLNATQNIEISSYVKKGTPAYTAGFEKNDILLTIDNSPLTSEKEFNTIVTSYPKQDAASITYIRDGKKRFSIVRLLPNPNIVLILNSKKTPSNIKRRKSWLHQKN